MSRRMPECDDSQAPVSRSRDRAAGPQRSWPPLRCRICWQVTICVFLSILAVEAVILVFSYQRREADLLSGLESRGQAALAAMLHWQREDGHELPELAESDLPVIHPVVGFWLFNASGAPLERFGSLPDLELGDLVAAGHERRLSPDGARYLVLWSGEDLGAPLKAVAALDSGGIAADLNGFVWRIVALTLVITLVVCGATMVVLILLVLKPLLALRGSMLAARDSPDKADSYTVSYRAGHELGEMVDAFNTLLGRLARRYRNDLQHSERRFHDFASSASDWYWEMDRELRFTYFSERFTDVTGIPPDLLLGKTRDQTAIPGVDPEAWRNHLADLAAHRPFRTFVHPRTKPDGTKVWLSINGRPHFDQEGNFQGYRGTGSDITRLKQAEEDLRVSRDKAEVANKAKSEFLANMSHEIRTPMTAVIGMAESLLGSDLSRDQRDKVLTVIRSGEGLLEIINEILDLSRLEAGKLELESRDIDLHGLVQGVRDMMAARAAPKGLALVFELPEDLPRYVHADGSRIRQILINLMENAIKFTEAGEVRVSLRHRPRQAGGLTLGFAVEDQGIGVAPGELDRLFEKFEQAESSTNRHYGGSGLGLAICKQLVELMGGRIGADSEVGEGSTFWFELPVAEALSPPRDEQTEGAARPVLARRSLKILLAEDNAVNQALLRSMLEPLGHRLSLAGNGQEAFEAALGEPFDLILMDVRMPLVDGLEATRMIRAAEGPNRAAPIVAVTADAMVGNDKTFLEAGMDAVTTKPVKLARLLATIDALLPEPVHDGQPAAEAESADDRAEDPAGGISDLLARVEAL